MDNSATLRHAGQELISARPGVCPTRAHPGATTSLRSRHGRWAIVVDGYLAYPHCSKLRCQARAISLRSDDDKIGYVFFR